MNLRHLVTVGPIVPAAAIPLQISGGADYPTNPPGATVLTVIALAVLTVRRW